MKDRVIDIRNDFPILNREVNGNPLVYLDNAATSQTPQAVIDVISDYYSRYNANIHRGVHALSQEATDAYEKARHTLQIHFNANNFIACMAGNTPERAQESGLIDAVRYENCLLYTSPSPRDS